MAVLPFKITVLNWLVILFMQHLFMTATCMVDSYVSYIFDVVYNSSQIVSSPIDVQFIDQTLSNYGAQHSQNMYPGVHYKCL